MTEIIRRLRSSSRCSRNDMRLSSDSSCSSHSAPAARSVRTHSPACAEVRPRDFRPGRAGRSGVSTAASTAGSARSAAADRIGRDDRLVDYGQGSLSLLQTHFLFEGGLQIGGRPPELPSALPIDRPISGIFFGPKIRSATAKIRISSGKPRGPMGICPFRGLVARSLQQGVGSEYSTL
jgi:hypothetical protein